MTCLGKILSQVKCEKAAVWLCIVVKRENCVGQSLLRFEVPEKKKQRGRLERWSINMIPQDMLAAGVGVEVANNRMECSKRICSGNPF